MSENTTLSDETFEEKIIELNGLKNTAVVEIKGDHAFVVENTNGYREYKIYQRLPNGLIEQTFITDVYDYATREFAESGDA